MSFFTCPHPEHCLVEGKNRPTKIACPPTVDIFVSKNCNNWPSPASAIARASVRFLNIPLTCRSSNPTTLHVRAISVVSLCWASCRRWASLPWKRASFTRAFSRFLLPCLVAGSYCFRLNERESRLSFVICLVNGFWFSNRRPSLTTADALMPTSTPTTGWGLTTETAGDFHLNADIPITASQADGRA